MTNRTSRLLILGFMLTVAFATLAVLTRAGGTDNASGSPVSTTSKLDQAKALAALPSYVGPDPANADPSKRISGDQIMAAAQSAAAKTPFPDNPDLTWATRFEGSISPEGVARITEVRAACAWSQHLVTTASADPSRQGIAEILELIPHWPAFANSSLGDGPRAVSAAVQRADLSTVKQYAQSCNG